MKTAIIILCMAGTAIAGFVEPFDKFNKENISARVSQKAGGKSMSNDYKTDYGSFDNTHVQSKTMEVVANAKSLVTIEFYFTFKSPEGSYIWKCDPQEVAGATPVYFTESAERRDTRLVMIGERIKSGEKIDGWICRIIKDGRVVFGAGSAERLKKLAELGGFIAD